MNTKKISAIFLSAALVIGCSIEGANLMSLFYEFGTTIRPNWYSSVNYLIAGFTALFFLGLIVGFGLTNSKKESWLMATITTIISLLVYRDIAIFSIENPNITHTHIVVLVLSVGLPYLVAHCTHKLFKLNLIVDTEIMSLEDRIKVRAVKLAEEQILTNTIPTLSLENKPQHIKEIAKDLLEEIDRVRQIQQQQITPTAPPKPTTNYEVMFPKEDTEKK